MHKDQPFYKDLIMFMTSGPIVVQVLEGEDAIAKNREVMGATNPVDAAPGTIRKDFGVNLQRNSVHGSDSPETAKSEIALCFKKAEIVGVRTRRIGAAGARCMPSGIPFPGTARTAACAAILSRRI